MRPSARVPGADDWDLHWENYRHAIAAAPAHEYRRHLILTHLGLESAASPRVLDIGSGLGDFLIEVHSQYSHVPKLGLESSQTAVTSRHAGVQTSTSCDEISWPT